MEKFVFKLKYDKNERKVKVFDGDGFWLGTLVLLSDVNQVCVMLDQTINLIDPNDYEEPKLDMRYLTLKTLKEMAIELADTSGIDFCIIEELNSGWTPVVFECEGFDINDIVYKTKPTDIDDDIFNVWMNK